jgi:hydroxymethylpyrimidine/phosphomethylpyrimidine kinase
METRVAVSVAGSDNSGGAGIQADLKTFTHFKVYGVTVVTCVVAEVPGKVLSIQQVEPGVIQDQLEVSLSYFPVSSLKTGMLYDRINIDLFCDAYEGIPDRRPFLVVDPVMIASSGDPLIQPDAVERYKARLFSLANLVTPNLDEAAVVLGRKLESISEMREAAFRLYEQYRVPFLLKGGHLRTNAATDLLIDSDGLKEFSEPYIFGLSTHGTGCTYSAAIAANMALGLTLYDAVSRAKKYITHAIADSFRWASSSGDICALRHFWTECA